MSCSEIINICVSIVSIFIALLALFQTKRQISLSNKQQLFDRRLSGYIKFNTIYSLYFANKRHLKKENIFCDTNDLVFLWLTNCSDLEEMTLAVYNPLHQEEQKIFLTKYEQLKRSAIEISMIFDGDTSRISGEFVATFADLLKAMYQQQVYISKLADYKKPDGKPMLPNEYEDKCKEMAKSLGLFDLCDKLEYLDDEIVQKRVAELMKSSIRLTKEKK